MCYFSPTIKLGQQANVLGIAMYYVLVAPFSTTCDKLTALYLVLLERVGGQKHSSLEKQLYREGRDISEERSFLNRDL